ncbi:hypothetical protein Bbelb_298240 [Branchiostoma belcheri]|nr:hypothetical protein Bbelb_298240 [Branchiostoma belcheri]
MSSGDQARAGHFSSAGGPGWEPSGAGTVNNGTLRTVIRRTAGRDMVNNGPLTADTSSTTQQHKTVWGLSAYLPSVPGDSQVVARGDHAWGSWTRERISADGTHRLCAAPFEHLLVPNPPDNAVNGNKQRVEEKGNKLYSEPGEMVKWACRADMLFIQQSLPRRPLCTPMSVIPDNPVTRPRRQAAVSHYTRKPRDYTKFAIMQRQYDEYARALSDDHADKYSDVRSPSPVSRLSPALCHLLSGPDVELPRAGGRGRRRPDVAGPN